MIGKTGSRVQSIATPLGTLRMRPQANADEPFLEALFESVRGADFAHLPTELKANLLRMQYRAMTGGYRAAFPDAVFEIILLNEQPVGRLIHAVRGETLHIVLTAFQPAWRGRGLGGALMRAVQAEAQRAGIGCAATVAVDNIASRRLWASLCFTEHENDGANINVRWQPGVKSA